MSRPHKAIQLAATERAALEKLIRASSSSQSKVFRARIIQLAGEGKTAQETADLLETTLPTVYKWRNRYAKAGLTGLEDKFRPGQPKKLSEAKVKEILDLTVHHVPEEATHWSIRLMAKAAGVTPWQVSQVWQASDLKPHRLQTFKISRDPHFSEKVIDVVGLYLNPPDNALVLSVDEKTQIQALERTQPLLPLKPGQAERRTHDYKRHGTTSLYAAFNVASGTVLAQVTERHRAIEFIGFLKKIDRETPKHLDLHLIVDNSSTHKTQEVLQWLDKHPRFHMHFTPTSASWLNAVEGWFAKLERRALYRGVFTSVDELKAEIIRFVQVHNQDPKPFQWTKSAHDILKTQKKLNKLINQTVH